MSVFDLEAYAKLMGGEYVLGTKDLHSRACYLIYGVLEPGEGDRMVRPGSGHEEILCAVDGPLLLSSPAGPVTLKKGNAVHLTQNDSFFIANPSQENAVRYVLAGGLIPLDTHNDD
jgi:hypothetical protein